MPNKPKFLLTFKKTLHIYERACLTTTNQYGACVNVYHGWDLGLVPWTNLSEYSDSTLYLLDCLDEFDCHAQCGIHRSLCEFWVQLNPFTHKKQSENGFCDQHKTRTARNSLRVNRSVFRLYAVWCSSLTKAWKWSL